MNLSPQAKAILAKRINAGELGSPTAFQDALANRVAADYQMVNPPNSSNYGGKQASGGATAGTLPFPAGLIRSAITGQNPFRPTDNNIPGLLTVPGPNGKPVLSLTQKSPDTWLGTIGQTIGSAYSGTPYNTIRLPNGREIKMKAEVPLGVNSGLGAGSDLRKAAPKRLDTGADLLQYFQDNGMLPQIQGQ